MNLTYSCRDVLQRLKTTDPRKCWEALIADYNQQNPTTQLLLLDSLIELKCIGTVLDYVSDFNVTVARLRSMSIDFDDRLLVAILLRGLPADFNVFCLTIRHREKVPTVDELCTMVKAEDTTLARSRAATGAVTVYTAAREGDQQQGRCSYCGRQGHGADRCWSLHPELGPKCAKCRKRGHLARFCGERATDRSEAHLGEDHYAGLFGGLPPVTL